MESERIFPGRNRGHGKDGRGNVLLAVLCKSFEQFPVLEAEFLRDQIQFFKRDSGFSSFDFSLVASVPSRIVSELFLREALLYPQLSDQKFQSYRFFSHWFFRHGGMVVGKNISVYGL